MKLHKDIALYKDAIRFTAQERNLRPEYVEKDYWVTYALHTIFHNEIGKEVVFKGGTSLSKCYKVIERFSEDIDLVVLRHKGESNNQLKNKLKKISNTIAPVLPETQVEGITQKRGMNRKTAHRYSKEFKENYGQVRDVILLESSWLGYYEPYTTRSIVSFVGQMMLENRQEKIAKENELLPFDVATLQPIRTICEKIMSLVRFSYSENPIDDLKNKIRHTYDLHQLLRQPEFTEFFNSTAFDKMLLKVAQDDVASFPNNNQWLANHPNESFIFEEPDKVWKQLKSTYEGNFRDLVYGDLPAEKDVLNTLKMIQNRMESVQWKL